MPTLYFGIANVIANGLIMLRYDSLPWTTKLFLTHPAPLSSGFLRIWKMITRIILLYEHSARWFLRFIRAYRAVLVAIRLLTVCLELVNVELF